MADEVLGRAILEISTKEVGFDEGIARAERRADRFERELDKVNRTLTATNALLRLTGVNASLSGDLGRVSNTLDKYTTGAHLAGLATKDLGKALEENGGNEKAASGFKKMADNIYKVFDVLNAVRGAMDAVTGISANLKIVDVDEHGRIIDALDKETKSVGKTIQAVAQMRENWLNFKDDTTFVVDLVGNKLSNAFNKATGSVMGLQNPILGVTDDVHFLAPEIGKGAQAIDMWAAAAAQAAGNTSGFGSVVSSIKPDFDAGTTAVNALAKSADSVHTAFTTSTEGVQNFSKVTTEMRGATAVAALSNTALGLSAGRAARNVEQAAQAQTALRQEAVATQVAVNRSASAFARLRNSILGLPIAIRGFVTTLPLIRRGSDEAARALDGLGDVARKAAKQVDEGSEEIGKSVASGTMSGIRSKAAEVSVMVKEFAGNIVTAAKQKLKIHSPSQEMADEVGKPISEGIAQGILKGLPSIEVATRVVVDTASKSFDKLKRSTRELGATSLDVAAKMVPLDFSLSAESIEADRAAKETNKFKERLQSAAKAAVGLAVAVGSLYLAVKVLQGGLTRTIGPLKLLFNQAAIGLAMMAAQMAAMGLVAFAVGANVVAAGILAIDAATKLATVGITGLAVGYGVFINATRESTDLTKRIDDLSKSLEGLANVKDVAELKTTLNELSKEGIDGLGILARASNTTRQNMQEMIDKGIMPSKEALDQLAKEGGQSLDKLKQQSDRTFLGMLKGLKTWLDDAMAAISLPVFNYLKDQLKRLVDFVHSPAVMNAIPRFTQQAQEWVTKLSRDLPRLISDIITWTKVIVTVFGAMAQPIRQWLGLIGQHFQAIDIHSQAFADRVMKVAQVMEFFGRIMALSATIVGGFVSGVVGGLKPAFEGLVGAMEGATSSAAGFQNLLVLVRDAAKQFGTNLGNTLAAILKFGATILEVANDTGILGRAMAGLQEVNRFIVGVFDRLDGILRSNAGSIGRILNSIGDTLGTLFRGLETVVNEVLGVIDRNLSGIASWFSSIMKLAQTAINTVIGLFQSLRPAIETVLQLFLKAQEVLFGVANTVLTALQPALKIIGDIISWIATVIGPPLMTLLDSLQAVFDAVGQAVGSAVNEFTDLYNQMKPFLDLLAGALGMAFKMFMEQATFWMRAIVPMIQAFAQSLSLAKDALIGMLGPFGAFLGPLGDFVKGMGGAKDSTNDLGTSAQNTTTQLDILKNKLDELKKQANEFASAMGENQQLMRDLDTIVSTMAPNVQGLWKEFKNLADAQSQGKTLTAAQQQRLAELTQQLTAMDPRLKDITAGYLEQSKQLVDNTKQWQNSTIAVANATRESDNAKQSFNLLKGGIGDLGKALSDVPDKANKAGNAIGVGIGQGVKTGIESTLGAVKAAGEKVVEAAEQAARQKGLIKSPSQLMAENVGKPLGEGIAMGIEQSTSTVTTQIQNTIGEASKVTQAQLDDFNASIQDKSDELKIKIAQLTSGIVDPTIASEDLANMNPRDIKPGNYLSRAQILELDMYKRQLAQNDAKFNNPAYIGSGGYGGGSSYGGSGGNSGASIYGPRPDVTGIQDKIDELRIKIAQMTSGIVDTSVSMEDVAAAPPTKYRPGSYLTRAQLIELEMYKRQVEQDQQKMERIMSEFDAQAAENFRLAEMERGLRESGMVEVSPGRYQYQGGGGGMTGGYSNGAAGGGGKTLGPPTFSNYGPGAGGNTTITVPVVYGGADADELAGVLHNKMVEGLEDYKQNVPRRINDSLKVGFH